MSLILEAGLGARHDNGWKQIVFAGHYALLLDFTPPKAAVLSLHCREHDMGAAVYSFTLDEVPLPEDNDDRPINISDALYNDDHMVIDLPEGKAQTLLFTDIAGHAGTVLMTHVVGKPSRFDNN